MNKGMIFMGIGFELVSLVLAAIFLGGYVDRYMGWNGGGTMMLILLMMVGWFVHLFVLLKKLDEDAKTPPKH